ncbi:hypothetical protein BD410DRAFT_731942 [Rickenella mellea]|uniref:Uncharacterized protein n=1 Tax=Rickenella mellea TaxID=50990 RepID=A0A4Y7PKI2_9AGAM|nr:hypothetical protein BD410DRAFT_731942 [Rickenella mellea]
MWKFSRHSTTPSIETLVLTGVHTSARALILNLGALWCQIQFLTHCSPQMYTRQVWNEVICTLTKKARGFRVGLAFVFQSFVLCFNTLDLMFQVSWSYDRVGLPYHLVDVVDDYISFLQCVVDWVLSRIGMRRDGLAVLAIRGSPEIWGGVGVYTVNELFKMAGWISVFLPEREVVDNPSRLARLCEALYVYAFLSRDTLWSVFLYSSIHDGVLAPTQDQRATYANWLHIFGKERVFMSDHMGQLHDSYEVCHWNSLGTWSLAQSNIFDVFEPTDLRIALQRDGNLGHLVFGLQQWSSVVKKWSSVSPGDDPLTTMFTERGLLASPTYLHPTIYRPVILPDAQLRATWRHSKSYRAIKQLWSVTSPIPLNCVNRSRVSSVSHVEREATLFKNIIETKKVAIGPFEYCGNGLVVKGQGLGANL